MIRRSTTFGIFLAALLSVFATQPDRVSAFQPSICCDCGGTNPMMASPCDLPCLSMFTPIDCLQMCEVINQPATPCNLKLVVGAICTGTSCTTTGCCLVNASAARTVAGSMCVETTATSCPFLPGGTSFVAGGSCVGGLSGICASPTATATATQTATITQTPTNTPVPNGGECVTPGQCTSMFCVDGVCCDTRCDEPLQTCANPDNRGTCSPIQAPVPALSTLGLMVGFVALCAIAALALMWRRASQ